jgi:hypothetical protein
MQSPEDKPNREIEREIASALDQLTNEVQESLDAIPRRGPLPPTLYHFTDCEGLIGILSQKVIRASLATSLSDASETRYAISRVRSHMHSGSVEESSHGSSV